jgi:hypothetical protein
MSVTPATHEMEVEESQSGRYDLGKILRSYLRIELKKTQKSGVAGFKW